MISAVNEFILYDDMRYTRPDLRNRDQVKTPQGVQRLMVPVKVKGKHLQLIRETEIDGDVWAESHWKTLTANYRRAPPFDEVGAWPAAFYLQRRHAMLRDLNRTFIEAICAYLGIGTRLTAVSDYRLVQAAQLRGRSGLP